MRQGTYRNNFSGKLRYQSFKPSSLPLNPNIELTDEIMKLLMRSYMLLGKLDGITSKLQNKDLFVSMYIRKEALLSSQIEGTIATLDDVFDPLIDANMNQDVEEVINYIKAMKYADALVDELPITSRFIKQVHKILLSGTRGKEKRPGEFRRTQNWIGGTNSNIRTASFIPPNTVDMVDAFQNLENYIHYNDTDDILIKIALVHYQFETIHPFLDGNGRIGRLLISIMLKLNMLLSDNVLYLSYYLKKNQSEYYHHLSDVRKNGNYEGWIVFFLQGIIETSKDAIRTIEKLEALHNESIIKLSKQGRSKPTLMKVLSLLEHKPIMDIKGISELLEISFRTASLATEKMVELGILKQLNNKSRYRVFSYEEYLDILRQGT